LAACTVAVMIACRAVSSRIPGPIVAMLGATVAAYILKLPVETVGTRFGGIPSGLPHLAIPRWHAGLVHSLLGPAFTVAMLAGILMMVAYNMGEWREIPQVLKITKTDISVWLVTLGLTVFADLTVAVEAGMILAALLFITRVANTTTVSQVTDDYIEDGRIHI